MAATRLTDGGLETTLIFERGVQLPAFAAYPLLDHRAGRELLEAYWQPYLALAREHAVGFDVDTPTWRASTDWGRLLGHDPRALAAANRRAASFARRLADQVPGGRVTGVVGPRGDGYVVDQVMTAADAAAYHREQVEALVDGGVDQVAGMTLGYVAEAVGIASAARDAGADVVVSFTVETDGHLPDGTSLRAAVEAVDAATDGAPSGYMVNCAHPSHLDGAWSDGPWLTRLTGLRANASAASHAELDAATELDAGDPLDLARRYGELQEVLPSLDVVGGCCGSGLTHVRAIAGTCLGHDRPNRS